MQEKYYMSLVTGELVRSKREILRVAWKALWKHHFLSLRWKTVWLPPCPFV